MKRSHAQPANLPPHSPLTHSGQAIEDIIERIYSPIRQTDVGYGSGMIELYICLWLLKLRKSENDKMKPLPALLCGVLAKNAVFFSEHSGEL